MSHAPYKAIPAEILVDDCPVNISIEDGIIVSACIGGKMNDAGEHIVSYETHLKVVSLIGTEYEEYAA